jgi:hypothetical protein
MIFSENRYPLFRIMLLADQFYLIITVIFSETTGGLKGK